MKSTRLSVLALSLLACGTEPNGGVVTSGGGGTRVDASASSLGELTGACDAGYPAACSCSEDGGTKSGTQQCFQGNWLSCNCYGTPPATPGQVPVVDTGGTCKPGRYEGDFQGDYTSPYTFVGFPIPVAALSVTGTPGLAFTLNATSTGSGGEFLELTISDGYVKGTANGTFPFEGVLTGTLDCTTKTFVGQLEGFYCVAVCSDVSKGTFIGPITGNYDGTNFTFTNGTWDLIEAEGNKPLFADKYGGKGVWSAKWVGEGSVDLDSGVTTADPDAGVVGP